MLKIEIFDRDADQRVTLTADQIELIEWDGYPSASFSDADWFMVEVVGDIHSYFVDREDLDQQALEAILDYCEGIQTGSLEQSGSEQFVSEN